MGLYQRYAGERLTEIYNQLYAALGHSDWRPAASKLEVVIGAVLAQNTAWGNAKKALDSLSRNNLLPRRIDGTANFSICPEEVGQNILALSDEELGNIIRPAGFYRLKTRRLRAVLSFFADTCSFDLPWLAASRRHETTALRHSLLGLTGVGPETADNILLYALDRPTFVVDAYTLRLFGRHNLLPSSTSARSSEARYEHVRAMFMESMNGSAPMYSEYHALIIRACKSWCRKNTPNCPACPLGRGLWAWQSRQ